MSVTKIVLDRQSDKKLTSPEITTPTGIVKGDVGLGNVDNTADIDKPVSTAQQNAIDSAVVGLYDDRGNYDASGNTYPSSGGSGDGGAILKGDVWTISVAGTLPTGRNVEVGDLVRALVDSPGTTESNWAISQTNIGYTAENSANKKTSLSEDSDTYYPTQKAVKTAVDAKQDTLISGTNIKTINGSSLLDSGNIEISGATQKAVAISGTQNGTNKEFTLASSVATGSEQIFLNGQLLTPGSGNDYVISGTTVTFETGFDAPVSSDVLRAYGSY